MRSAGYKNVIKWISDIWDEFPSYAITNSFDACGITSKNNLHFALNKILDEKYFQKIFYYKNLLIRFKN